MEVFFVYLAKVSAIQVIFYLVYQLLLKRETFFTGNRHFLLAGILSALILPFVYITSYTKVAAPVSTNAELNPNYLAAASVASEINWIYIAAIFYGIGLLVFSLKLIFQLLSLRKLLQRSTSLKKDDFIHITTTGDTAPFSFLKYIVYNPNLYGSDELEAILKHERAHILQWHSLDILVVHVVTILLWPNPVGWLYRQSVQQNLEFLADAFAAKEVSSIQSYQRTLLKVSGNLVFAPITNNFYSSLIKKRIVMLHRKPSSKRNLMKYGIVLPLLITFLLLFNVKTIAKTTSSPVPVKPTSDVILNIDKMVYTITMATTEAQIRSLVEKVKNEGSELTVKKVKRNRAGHITSIKITYSSETGEVSGNYSNSEGIAPIYFGQNENGGLFISDTDQATSSSSEGKSKSKTIIIETEGDESDEEHKIVIADEDQVRLHLENGKQKIIEIEEVNGKKKIMVNGEEVSEEALEAMEKKHELHGAQIKVRKSKNDGKNSVIIIKDSDDEDDIEVIEEGGNSFFFIDTNGEENPLYYIDGKEATEKEVKKLSPEAIESMNVYKGEKAMEKYGDKAKDGVIEITTKKND